MAKNFLLSLPPLRTLGGHLADLGTGDIVCATATKRPLHEGRDALEGCAAVAAGVKEKERVKLRPEIFKNSHRKNFQ